MVKKDLSSFSENRKNLINQNMLNKYKEFGSKMRWLSFFNLSKTIKLQWVGWFSHFETKLLIYFNIMVIMHITVV